MNNQRLMPGSDDRLTSQTLAAPPIPADSSELTDLPGAGAAFESLRVIVLALLDRIEMLERQAAEKQPEPLDLRAEVCQFEAALIKAALMNTRGRQRRAARVLGMKVSTLNAKIRRYQVVDNTV